MFFLIYLVVGLLIYKDYGISWDEPSHRDIAIASAKHLSSIFIPAFQPLEFSTLPPLAEYTANHYGIIFDLPMYAAEFLLGYNGAMPEAYYLRHLCMYLLFFISTLFFYMIVRNRFESRSLGLIACSFLIMSPRFFAESFYSKDIVFFSFFVISIYFFIRYLSQNKLLNTLLFALSSALVVDQRIVGIFIPVLVVIITIIDVMKTDRTYNNIKKILQPLLLYLVSFSMFVVLFWPFLWENPVHNFAKAFIVMSKYPVSYYNLYLGTSFDFIKAPRYKL